MLNAFRIISLLEGLSYLLILSVTLGFIGREFVFFLGMGHGILFTLYLLFSLIVSGKEGWSVMGWSVLFLASLVPFAFIPVEIVLSKINKSCVQNVEPAL